MTAILINLTRARAARSAGPTPNFTDLASAVRWWRQQPDQEPLHAAMRPPVDALDDAIHDVALATMFRQVVLADSMVEQIGTLQIFVDLNRRQAAAFEAWAERERALGLAGAAARETTDAVQSAVRVERMCKVLEGWKSAILDGAGA